MAIITNNEKLAIMEWCQVWDSGLPLSPGTLGQDDKQQLLWGYPGILWGVAVTVEERSTNVFWRRKMRKKQKIWEEEEVIMQMIKEFLEEHG